MRLLKIRFKLWNAWRKQSKDGLVTKLLNLFGIITSPTFALYCSRRAIHELNIDDFVYWIVRVRW